MATKKTSANSVCSDFSGSASAHSLQRTASASHSFASHNPENSSTILEFASSIESEEYKNKKTNDSTKEKKEPKLRPLIKGANGLSLGISIVVAILLGIGAGVLMQKIFGVFWVLFLGVAWGIAAAVLNVYKVYKAELRDFEKIADDPKYKQSRI